ncbi:MAG: hypothetical protein HYX97_00155 [Chloroflexi bacterium]|nr:hypothetical protein [Chloroflexota bacterium]
MAPKKDIQQAFGIEPWVVPVHRYPERCHRKDLQIYAYELGRAFLDASTDPRFEQLCKDAFDAGFLPAPLFLRRKAWSNTGDPEQRPTQLGFALNAAAGCGSGSQLIREMRAMDMAELQGDSNRLIYIASADANLYGPNWARHVCRELQAAVPRVLTRLSQEYAKLIRVQTTVNPSVRGAREAVSLANDSHDPTYHRRTSHLILASSYEAENNYVASRDIGEAMAREITATPGSQWHSVQVRTFWARAVLLTEGPKVRPDVLRWALGELTLAQYTAAFFDWVGIPMPDSRAHGPSERLVPMRPTDVLHWIGFSLKPAKGELLEIRRAAIFGEDASQELSDNTRPLGVQGQLIGTIRKVLHSPPGPGRLDNLCRPKDQAIGRSLSNKRLQLPRAHPASKKPRRRRTRPRS